MSSVDLAGKRTAEAASESGPGAVLRMIATGRARSRADLGDQLGWSRSTIAQHLQFLFEAGLLIEAEEGLPSGGRPSRHLRLDPTRGVVLAADIGERGLRLAIADNTTATIADVNIAMDVASGPLTILDAVAGGFVSLLGNAGRTMDGVIGIGLGLPAPVDFAAGRVVGPSVMRGWDCFDVRSWMRERFDVPVFVENDVNLMTLAEVRQFWPDVANLFFLKVGNGIGSGIIADGKLYRGAQGAAGDVGHMQVHGPQGPLCRCGKLGCVEAYAAGWAVARDLGGPASGIMGASDVVAEVRRNRPEAIRLVRDGGRLIGEAVANVVSVLNPSVIVVGGTLAATSDHLLAGIRELIYQRSLPLATRELTIAVARGGGNVNISGAAALVMDTVLEQGVVDRFIERHAKSPIIDGERRAKAKSKTIAKRG